MAGKPTPVTTEQITEFASRLRKLADVCDVALKQMATNETTRVYVSGHATAELSYERIHSFVNNVIGESFNPSKSSQKSPVDIKIEEADMLLDALQKQTTSKPKPQKRKT